MSIVYEVSNDPVLLQQYYDLRERCFREELGIHDFDGSEDARDREGVILLAIQDGRCIGGARIAPGLPVHCEHEDFTIDPYTSCMWERFVVDPAVRTIELIREFLVHLIEVSNSLGYHLALILSSLRNARFYRQCHSALGVHFKILRRAPECAQGSFAGLEHYLSVSQLREDRVLRLAA